MSTKPTEVKALVEGGKASPGPPLGPALGPLRVNVAAVIAEINKVTSSYSGMTVPVVVKVFPGKPPTFEIEVKTPSTSALLKKAAGVEKGSGEPNTNLVGDITFKALIEVTEGKMDEMLGKTLKSAAKEVIGTAMSTGITIEGKSAKEVLQEVNEGEYDEFFK